MFTECSFLDCRLNLSRHSDAAFLNCTFTGCSFFDAAFTDCKLVGSTFDRCTFDLIRVAEADLTGADLRGSDLSAVDPRNVRLEGATVDVTQSVVLTTALGLTVRPDGSA